MEALLINRMDRLAYFLAIVVCLSVALSALGGWHVYTSFCKPAAVDMALPVGLLFGIFGCGIAVARALLAGHWHSWLHVVFVVLLCVVILGFQYLLVLRCSGI